MNFEEQLHEMEKPEISSLEHQHLLESAIIQTKDRSAVSAWWLCLPLYVVTTLTMKTFYVPGSTIISNLQDMQANQPVLSILLFVFVPTGSIILNMVSLKRLYDSSGGRSILQLPGFALLPVLMIIVSFIILFVYIF